MLILKLMSLMIITIPSRSMSTKRTLSGFYQHLNVVKASKFYANVKGNINNIDEALAFVKEISEPKASHACWAYIGKDDYIRFSDDGEPSGAGGKPIQIAIEGENLCGVVCVVNRYFGGTKLGLGGMARAYGGACRDCLRDALEDENNIIELVPTQIINFVVPFADAGVIYQIIGEFEKSSAPLIVNRLNEETTDSNQLSITIQLPINNDDIIDKLKIRCNELGAGRITLKLIDEE